jgi:UDP-N-acetylmuramyl pentapeptide phosphotransferase/UDP-N-acetylglucosamine-1-phosphate transferase
LSPAVLALALAASLVSFLVVRAVREHAHAQDLLDHPNDRSSHVEPTPRLGGIGIMVAFLAAGAAGLALAGGPPGMALALAATAAISALGLVDDLRPLPARYRFAIQVVVALAVVLSTGGARGSPWLQALPWPLGPALLVLWMVWLTNLYNFMDGIDGLAGGQAVAAGLAIAAVAFAAGAPATGALALALAGAAAGFLLLNFPPATIFMGDVGSTAIGFFLASVPLLPDAAPVPLEVVALALAFFILDATLTLLRRAWRGERWFEAHRTHLYQRPVAMGIPHRRVTLVAYAGMVLAALCAVALPGAAPAARVLLLAVPGLVFGALVVAVRRMEARRRVGSAGASPGRGVLGG